MTSVSALAPRTLGEMREQALIVGGRSVMVRDAGDPDGLPVCTSTERRALVSTEASRKATLQPPVFASSASTVPGTADQILLHSDSVGSAKMPKPSPTISGFSRSGRSAGTAAR